MAGFSYKLDYRNKSTKNRFECYSGSWRAAVVSKAAVFACHLKFYRKLIREKSVWLH
jgi:hypothetical protein